MKTFVINLAHRQDRMEEMQNANVPFPVERFEATSGEQFIDIEDRKRMRGALGCWDSHRRLLHKIQDEGHPMALVLEDDCDFIEGDMAQRIHQIMSELPDDWDLLYLGGDNKEKTEIFSQSLNHAKMIWQTHAYIVRDKFLPTLIKAVESYKYKVDIVFCEAMKRGNCFIANPVIAVQRKSYSDITFSTKS